MKNIPKCRHPIRVMMRTSIIVFLVLCMIFLWISAKFLTVSDYLVKVTSPKSSIKCIFLTDLHNRSFGVDNRGLIKKIQDMKPDIICMAGDMLNGDEAETDVITSLIRSLSELAPLYYSYGNHEKEYESTYDRELKPMLESAGAHVLEYGWEDVEINGLMVRIGGIYGYCLPPKFKNPAKKSEQEFVNEFQNTDRYKILLCHMPVCWMINDGLDGWDVDLVLAGHNHGGQIIIPFIGGLYAPDMGWFPGRVWGEFSGSETDHKLIVSRGLGNESIIPRINNIPEIVSIEIGGDDE